MIQIKRILWIGIVIASMMSCSTQKSQSEGGRDKITRKQVKNAQKIIGIEFENEHIDVLKAYLDRNLNGYDSLRHYSLPQETFPSLVFDHHPVGYILPQIANAIYIEPLNDIKRPDDDSELAFYTIR